MTSTHGNTQHRSHLLRACPPVCPPLHTALFRMPGSSSDERRLKMICAPPVDYNVENKMIWNKMCSAQCSINALAVFHVSIILNTTHGIRTKPAQSNHTYIVLGELRDEGRHYDVVGTVPPCAIIRVGAVPLQNDEVLRIGMKRVSRKGQ